MVRVLELLIGLPLAGVGVGASIGAVLGGITAGQRILGGTVVFESGIGFVVGFAAFAALTLLVSWKLIRSPRRAGAPGRRRWVPLSVGSVMLTVVFGIAYPNFVNFSKAGPTSEPRLVLGAITTAERAYFHEFGEYLAFDSVPSGPPSSSPVEPSEYPAGAMELGWSTGGPVYCRYAVAVGSPATGGGAQAFTAEAICDRDGDGVSMAWGYVRPDRGSGEAVPGPFGRCPAEGAIDRFAGERRPGVVGPCDARSGVDVF